MQKPKEASKLYEIDYPAAILKLVYDEYAYTLLSPLDVKLSEISVKGAKIRAAKNALPDGGKFEMRFEINGVSRYLLAEVTGCASDGGEGSEYACRFCSNVIPMERVAL